jgi:addiction module RelE/StbE family toxin
MIYKVVFLPEAKSDSEEIKRYLSQYYKSTVKNFFALLKKRVNLLKTNPFLAPSCPERPSYRQLLVDEYLAFYKVNEDKQLIEIHRILHESKDIGRYVQ